MKAKFFTIRCITNMHMGSGDVNFNIIDNEVQRDPVTKLPTMFSSSVKGALREHFEKTKAENIRDIFGNAIKENESAAGKVKFLSGNLLLLPVRASKGPCSYYMVTSYEMLREYEKMQKVLGTDVSLTEGLDAKKNYGPANIGVDGIDVKCDAIPNENIVKVIQELCGEDVASKLVILSAENLRKINLPVLARNSLNENGISENLWYEEVVPHESVFYMAVISDGTAAGDCALESLSTGIKSNNLIQFGGNASIGYGLTEVKEV